MNRKNGERRWKITHKFNAGKRQNTRKTLIEMTCIKINAHLPRYILCGRRIYRVIKSKYVFVWADKDIHIHTHTHLYRRERGQVRYRVYSQLNKTSEKCRLFARKPKRRKIYVLWMATRRINIGNIFPLMICSRSTVAGIWLNSNRYCSLNHRFMKMGRCSVYHLWWLFYQMR